MNRSFLKITPVKFVLLIWNRVRVHRIRNTYTWYSINNLRKVAMQFIVLAALVSVLTVCIVIVFTRNFHTKKCLPIIRCIYVTEKQMMQHKTMTSATGNLHLVCILFIHNVSPISKLWYVSIGKNVHAKKHSILHIYN